MPVHSSFTGGKWVEADTSTTNINPSGPSADIGKLLSRKEDKPRVEGIGAAEFYTIVKTSYVHTSTPEQ